MNTIFFNCHICGQYTAVFTTNIVTKLTPQEAKLGLPDHFGLVQSGLI